MVRAAERHQAIPWYVFMVHLRDGRYTDAIQYLVPGILIVEGDRMTIFD